MNTSITPVILSGGSGTRLWPLSREGYPKQFLHLAGDISLFQMTAQRVDFLEEPVLTVCSEQHRFMVAEQLRELGRPSKSIILEPCARNTAPAIAIAALRLVADDAEAMMLVLPADHLIADTQAFAKAVAIAAEKASAGNLVTFGIVPDKPETGYGYIRRGDDLNSAYNVAAFVEKPDLATAQAYLKDGHYYWNSGMFLFKAAAFLEELEHYNKAMRDACQVAFEKSVSDLDFLRLDAESFAACPSNSIDYAVMEKTAKAVVVPLDAGWNDIGAWSALWEVGAKDDAGNVIIGDCMLHDCKNSYVRSEHHLVSVIGLDDVVVVETPDAVMVAARDRVQDVKDIVTRLKKDGRSEANAHREVYRPWGKYDSVDNGERFQVKRITVNPGAKLSLQKHYNRAEHWIVVSGTAEITCGGEVKILTENQSTYIPVGVEHRLANPSKIPLEIIEVQSGSYLGEDDIVRINDEYGRCE